MATSAASAPRGRRDPRGPWPLMAEAAQQYGETMRDGRTSTESGRTDGRTLANLGRERTGSRLSETKARRSATTRALDRRRVKRPDVPPEGADDNRPGHRDTAATRRGTVWRHDWRRCQTAESVQLKRARRRHRTGGSVGGGGGDVRRMPRPRADADTGHWQCGAWWPGNFAGGPARHALGASVAELDRTGRNGCTVGSVQRAPGETPRRA